MTTNHDDNHDGRRLMDNYPYDTIGGQETYRYFKIHLDTTGTGKG